VPRVRALTEVRIASRTPAHARALAEEAASILAASAGAEPRVVTSETFEEAVRGADIVCACTDAHHPVLEFEWLTPGAHVNSVGGSHGRELDAATVYRGKLFVEWRGAVTSPPMAGAGELQGLDPDTAVELGELLAGRRSGRASDEDITVYKSTGHAVEDVAAARLVYDRAVEAGLGTKVSI
jgi:ornithine cyclodeaminase/alanine dehydrogenase-like protein (mu-crystallin family)